MEIVYTEKCRIWYMYGIFEMYGIGGMLFVLVVMIHAYMYMWL